ncbi:Tudor and KH domain-containing protein [Orchesella cincta]|uniref:Tudor and KH domain-containing protein n=1 Tax=Orchesella cincta TaxID=48709 RepID=A0A1D2N4Y0_ORCCI|nr:Tudor and KH domain-containing protein [Orchesella cincta]
MRIPREIVPGLIGKKGVNIKAMQAQSNTSMTFHDETLENGDRLCVIQGSPANVTLAESIIQKYITEQPIVYTETVTVPLSSVGRIIGRGGETIRAIQEQSKARVNIESHNHYGADAGPTRSITIKGSESQILIARQLIIEKVEEERHLRKNIDMTTASRTPRRPGGASLSPSSPSVSLGPSGSSSTASVNTGSTEPALPLKQDGILEVFVSCVYHPNDFWIQVVGRDSVELDKLCESMTDYYSGQNEPRDENQFNVGDIVAAPFEVDGKIYRAKIMQMDDNGVEVSYLDYGDRRVLSASDIHELHPSFLQLRFQAIQATLNLGCIGDNWNDETINEFCDKTYCAQWQSLTAKVKDYLKDVEDGHDVIWLELLDKNANIGEDLIRKGLATPKGPSGCNGAQSFQKKSYAAVALGVSAAPSEPLITAADPTIQESLEHDRNGN